MPTPPRLWQLYRTSNTRTKTLEVGGSALIQGIQVLSWKLFGRGYEDQSLMMEWCPSVVKLPYKWCSRTGTATSPSLPLSSPLPPPSLPLSSPERVLACKEEGNAHFAKRKYKKAVAAYTEGISIGDTNCNDPALFAVLYCNRAAAQFHLGVCVCVCVCVVKSVLV